MLRLTTFGGLALSRDGVALTGAAAQRSRLSLLALLATAGPTGFSREKLLLYLWPESDEERARHALKQAVYSLRRELGSDEVIVGTASLSLNPLMITSDAREFEAAIAAGDLATAVSLYNGPFLDGFHLKDSTEYERWSAEQRSRFAHMWVTAVEKLAADCEAKGAWRDAAGHWRALAASEPLSGRLALSLMRCLAESGDLGAALQQYKIHETLLREEIGSAPEAAVSALAESLRSGKWARSPDKAVTRADTEVSRPSGDETIGASAEIRGLANDPGIGGSPERPIASIPDRSIGPSQTRPSIGTARKRRRRSTAVAFILGFVLMGTLALAVRYFAIDPDKRATLSFIRGRPDAVLASRRIVVAPFENKTNDSTLDVLGEQISDWFARELSEADFDVVDSRTARIGTRVVEGIPRPLKNRDFNVALGEETGSAYAVVGTVFRQRDSLEGSINVINVANRRTVKYIGPIYGSANDPDGFIRAMLQPTITYLSTEVDTTAGGLTTKYSSPPSLAAFRRVNRAWEKFFENPRDTLQVFAELDSAARLDSTYATPLLMKAYMLDVKSQWPAVNQVVSRVRPLAPEMSKLERAALDLFEADLQGDAFKRLEVARRLQTLSPGSGEMPLLRVVSALYVGNVAEALAALNGVDPARGMNLITPTYLEWAAATYHHSGQASLEEKAVRDELARFRHHPPATYGLARVYAARNDDRLADLLAKGIPPAKDMSEVRDPFADRMDLMLLAGRELRAHGFPEQARKVFAQAAEELRKAPASTIDAQRRRARALYEAADYQSSRDAFAEILRRDSTDMEAMARIATSSLRLGDPTTARQMDERLAGLKLSFPMGAPLRWRATIAAAQGHPEAAVELLDSAVRRGHRLLDSPPNLTVHLDPEFVGIEKWASYKTMLRSLADISAAK